MTLVLGIELLEAYKIAYEVYVVELITPTAWLPACLAAWVSRNFFPGESSVGVINSIMETSNASYASQGPQNQKLRSFSLSVGYV